MNFARFSPVLALGSALVFSLIGPAKLQAGASNKNGNPYGNGTFFSDSGSYSSIVRGTNGFIGTIEFTTSSTNTSTNATTNSGIATIYASGQQFVGSAYGAQDPASQTLAVTYFANTAGQIVALPTVSYNAETLSTLSNGVANVIYVPTFGVTNFSVSNNVSGQFSASLQNSYPNQTFSGTGEANAYIQQVSALPITNQLSTNQTGITYEYLLTESNIVYNNTVNGSRVVIDSTGLGQ